MEEKKIEQGIKDVLKRMSNILNEEQITLFSKFAQTKSFDNIKTPKDLFYNILYPFEKYISGFVRTKIYNDDDVVFIYKNYGFLENHLTNLFEVFEGSACCADKSKTIIKRLVDFFKDKKRIEFDYDDVFTFHLPKLILKDHDNIVNFYKSLVSLYHGNPTNYFTEMLKLKKIVEENKD